MSRFAKLTPAWTVIAVIVAAVVIALVARPDVHVAAAPAAVTADTVHVDGSGTASTAPDTVSADFSVHLVRPTVDKALGAMRLAAHKVIASLQSNHVPSDDVTTTDLELNRHYDNHGRVDGWEADETLTARISPLSIAGKAIGAAATAAGSGVTVGDISFDLAHDTALLASARANAYDSALAKAQQYAKLTGRPLGPVVNLSEVVHAPNSVPLPGYAKTDLLRATNATSLAGPASLPLEGGKNTVQVHVDVTWSLR